jgi:RNA polymerase sigma factor (sigma-70 family)
MPSNPGDSPRPSTVTAWIQGIAGGDPSAIEKLWHRYYERLVRLARRKLGERPRRVADEEDVAQLAFHSFCKAARAGRFPDLADRDELWRLLVKITARKAIDLIRYNTREKRRVLGESAIVKRDEDGQCAGLDRVIGESPTPEFAAQVADECRHLLEGLGDAELRALAVAKMEGRTNEEIARDLGCSIRTVERQLHLIRKKWEAVGGA